MDQAAYTAFLEAHKEGRKSAATAALRAFIASFASSEEKAAWVAGFLETHDPETRIRHELYDALVLPVLAKGYHASDVWSTKWLAMTVQNLYQAKHLWAQLDFVSGHALLRSWRALAPGCDEARTVLLNSMIDRFRFSEHEWPGVILCGMDGATLEQCREIADQLVETRSLDHGGIWTSFLDEFEEKLSAYQQRLRR